MTDDKKFELSGEIGPRLPYVGEDPTTDESTVIVPRDNDVPLFDASEYITDRSGSEDAEGDVERVSNLIMEAFDGTTDVSTDQD